MGPETRIDIKTSLNLCTNLNVVTYFGKEGGYIFHRKKSLNDSIFSKTWF